MKSNMLLAILAAAVLVGAPVATTTVALATQVESPDVEGYSGPNEPSTPSDNPDTAENEGGGTDGGEGSGGSGGSGGADGGVE